MNVQRQFLSSEREVVAHLDENMIKRGGMGPLCSLVVVEALKSSYHTLPISFTQKDNKRMQHLTYVSFVTIVMEWR